MELSPETLQAILGSGGAGSVVTGVITWIVSRKRTENKFYNNNGSSPKPSGISKKDHKECKEERKKTEQRLFEGQAELRSDIKDNRREARDDVKRLSDNLGVMASHGTSQRKDIFSKLDRLFDEISKINKGSAG